MDDLRDLEYLRKFEPIKSALKMRVPRNEFSRVEDECPPPDKTMKFLSQEVEVITPLGWGWGRYNYMDDDWLVELGNDSSDELQAYKSVTHWRLMDYQMQEERITFDLNKRMLKGLDLI